MKLEQIKAWFLDAYHIFLQSLESPQTYLQIGALLVVYGLAYAIAYKIKASFSVLKTPIPSSAHPLRTLGFKLGAMLFPMLALVLLKLSQGWVEGLEYSPWVIKTALVVAVLLFFHTIITAFVPNPLTASAFHWIGIPLLLLQMFGLLPSIVTTLSAISVNLGNVSISVYGVLRFIIFGGFLFWLGRVSNSFGQAVIKKQTSLDNPTKEVFSKLFEVVLFCVITLLLLNVMGINLTTLAVFGGAVGVGLGLGLQSIASNFISGIIILLDRSLTVGDYVELDDGQKGFVREFKMRYTVLETYDGKDILVPNEKFISSMMINWTHKDPKQRYRVDFSVAYSTDIRSMVEIIKEVVSQHPQVISGDDIPVEDRPDCEIDSFGDSGVNMFVEFWMMGIDDGKNRVGGDLLLTIFETLREHNIEIPFPQREVRILNPQDGQSPVK